METRNCPRCGKLFTFISSRICQECMKDEEEAFNKVKQYIQENPNNRLLEVAENTGVSGRKILGYIKEGRIVVSKGLSDELKCEHCGKPITSGKYCDSCIIKINDTVNEVFKKETPEATMHITKLKKY